MKATEVILNTFLSQSKTQFVIPVYQRNYDWMEAQCVQLFNDILQVGNSDGQTHFIGSIVFIHDGVYSSSEVRKLVVIDGQQRLTTFSLLYLALYKFALQNELVEKANEVREFYLINKYVKDDGSKLKLKQSDSNAKAFSFILGENDATKYSEYSRVIENYNFFLHRITQQNFETILRGIGCLLFVEISLERGKDDPQKIFESLNSTGLELSQADLIRNYILMGLVPEEQIRVFNQFWEIIEGNARDEEKEESKVSDFIRDYLTFKLKKIPNKGKVYEEFKAQFPHRDTTFYTHTLAELKEFSYHYRKFLNPSREPEATIRKQLEYVQRLEFNIAYPFLLPLFDDYREKKLSKDDLIAILKLLQSYVWRRFVVGLPTNALNKVFMILYNDIDPSNYLTSVEKALVRKKGTSKMPTDEEVRLALLEKDIYTVQAKNRTYFFELLENHNNREFVAIDNPAITVEHIFPQNPDEKWYLELKPEEVPVMQKYLNTIANLTLSGNNGSLSNKTFHEKKSMDRDGKQQGYKYSRLWLNHYLNSIDAWNEKSLRERYDLILQRFYEIWKYPEVDEMDEEGQADEDFTIYNAPDPTNRKLDYFIFRDQKIETTEVSNMYTHVVHQLYSENPSAFHHEEVKKLLGLSTNKDDFRACHEIGPNYYMEMNLSNTAKFGKLKGLLPRFNAEEDLLVNFSSENLNAELSDPTYWVRRTSSDIVAAVESCYRLIHEIDQSVVLQHRVRHIGLKRNGTVMNFVFFVPTPSFIRVLVRLAEPGKWVDGLKQRKIEFLGVNPRNSRVKFRLKRDTVEKHKDFLKEMFHQAYSERVN
jgi:uncharacterized protein with ParB-like and HNH nuclease domain